MRKPLVFILSFLSAAVTVSAADTLRIREFRHIGPLSVKAPVPFDSLDVKGKAFDSKSLLSAAVNTGALQSQPLEPADSLPAGEGIHLFGFELSTPKFSKGSITVDGLKNYKLTVDDVETSELKLKPGRHKCVIRAMADTAVQKFSVRVVPDSMGVITLHSSLSPLDFERLWASDLSFGSEISPDGTMYRTSDYHYESDGTGYYTREVKDIRTGETLCDGMYWQWMPKSNLLWRERTRMKNREIVTRDPRTGKESVLADHLPDGKITLSPNEDFIIFTIEEEGPAEDPGVFEVLNPDDRQPGWRDRNRLALYRFADGILQPLTHGYRNLTLKDISQDGRMILISQHDMNLPVQDRDVTHRSSTVQSFFTMNLETFEVDTLVVRDGFLTGAMFTRDGTKVVYKGSPDSFGGIGRNVPKGMIANAFDYQLYLQDLSSKQVTALTRDFDPSVEILDLSLYDGKFYFTALNRDSVSFYSLDPDTRQIARIVQPEEVVNTFWLARTSPAFTLIGEGALNQRRIWAGTLPAAEPERQSNGELVKLSNCRLLTDLSAENLAGLDMPTCEGWTFRNRRGMTITTHYFLPPAFDASRKYPMIVYYYGGCVPVSRNFGKNWPFPLWASMGYVVLVVNPRGAAGFGQKYSAWHVNTAGREVADDIIGAVRKFTASHPWVNSEKIGCMGASYGGFMTQYLLTQTDLFACAVSHAGISDHTSYWGEGYWGYSYSEVSMAGSYPWSERSLYVDQSPLYNADKIHTPLLFTHGTKDTNVPVGESIQLFTALKVLGRETAFVAFDGENHHIADPEKNHRWQLTQMAWFQRWLQDDDTWWFELYSKKDL